MSFNVSQSTFVDRVLLYPLSGPGLKLHQILPKNGDVPAVEYSDAQVDALPDGWEGRCLRIIIHGVFNEQKQCSAADESSKLPPTYARITSWHTITTMQKVKVHRAWRIFTQEQRDKILKQCVTAKLAKPS